MKQKVPTVKKKILPSNFSHSFERPYAMYELQGPVQKETPSQVEGSLPYPSYTGRLSQLFIHFLTKRDESFTRETKKLARLEGGATIFNGGFTLLARPAFLHINTLARPAMGQLGSR